MNIDLVKFESHRKTKDYLDNIIAHGLYPSHYQTHPNMQLISHALSTIYIQIIVLQIGHSGIIITDVADHFA